MNDIECLMRRYIGSSLTSSIVRRSPMAGVITGSISTCASESFPVERWEIDTWPCPEGCDTPTLSYTIRHFGYSGSRWRLVNVESYSCTWDGLIWVPTVGETCWLTQDGRNMMELLDDDLILSTGMDSGMLREAPICPGIKGLGGASCSCPSGFIDDSSHLGCCRPNPNDDDDLEDDEEWDTPEDCDSYSYKIFVQRYANTDNLGWSPPVQIGSTSDGDSITINRSGFEALTGGYRNYMHWAPFPGGENFTQLDATFLDRDAPGGRAFIYIHVTIVVSCGGVELRRYGLGQPLGPISDPDTPPPPPDECRLYIGRLTLGYTIKLSPIKVKLSLRIADSEPYCSTPPPGWIQALINLHLIPTSTSIGVVKYEIIDIGSCRCP